MACPRCGFEGKIEGGICPKCKRDINQPLSAGETTFMPAIEAETLKDLQKEADQLSGPALIVEKGPTLGVAFSLNKPAILIGRHLGSDIFLDDITVSRKHAEISVGEDGFLLKDLGSLNGTYVNEELIEEVFLTSGDKIQIGRFKLRFMSD